MNKYYCHDCAEINGTLRPPPDGHRLTENSYKLEKYIKHTIPSSCSGYKTVFTGVSSETYQNCIVTAVSSGHVQIDKKGRTNIVWVGSEYTGIALSGGAFVGRTNAVKVVCHSDTNKIHGYPIFADELKLKKCLQCGRTIPY